MEREEILSEIKTRIGDPSAKGQFSNISERTLSDYVERIWIPEADQINDEFYEAHLGILKSVAGNIRHVASTAVEEFKKNYKPDATTQPPPATPPVTPPGNDLETRIKAFEEWQKKQEEERMSSARMEAIKSKTSDVMQKLKAKGASNEVVLELVGKTLVVKEDSDAEALLKEAEAIYEDRNAKLYGEGYNPAQGSSFPARTISPAEREKAISEHQKKYREKLRV